MSEKDNGSVELYKKHRPTKLSELIGQEQAVKVLQRLGKENKIPHAILLTGPSGCGKTTIARILASKLKCGEHDFAELNNADFRGIDTVRSIRERMSLKPISGDCRVWLLDEVHNATSQSQEALLKMLEDTPSHVYFMLATTDPRKLRATIRTRCTEIAVRGIPESGLVELVNRTADAEGVEISEAVAAKIAENAAGSARKALVLLHGVLGLSTDEERLTAIQAAETEAGAIELARLIFGNGTWKKAAGLLEKLKDEDAEGIRRVVLGYARSVLIRSGDARAAAVIDAFWRPLYDIGHPGLALMCWELFQES